MVLKMGWKVAKEIVLKTLSHHDALLRFMLSILPTTVLSQWGGVGFTLA